VRSIQIANEELTNLNTTDAHKPVIHADHLTYKLDTIFSFPDWGEEGGGVSIRR
jgi:hypothetical protein